MTSNATRRDKLILFALKTHGIATVRPIPTLANVGEFAHDYVMDCMRKLALTDQTSLKDQDHANKVDEALNYIVGHRRSLARPGTLPVFLTQRELRLCERLLSSCHEIASEKDGKTHRSARRAIAQDIVPLATEENPCA
jgi:hypothetical protein